jgi:hypothetical protein
MEPNKAVRSTRRGLLKLAPRIAHLKAELKRLQDAEHSLILMKWEAETELIEVTMCPANTGSKSPRIPQKPTDPLKLVSIISDSDAVALMKILERRLGK